MTGIILGLGNEILCDDAVGIRLARRLADDLGRPGGLDLPGWEIAWGELGPLETAERLAGHEAAILIDAILIDAILIDAVKTPDRPPGTLSVSSLGDLQRTEHLGWRHGMNLETSVRFLAAQGAQLPSRIAVIGVSITDNTLLSETMTPELEERFEDVLAETKETVRRLAGEMGEGPHRSVERTG